jgi:uncharacterized glyoxalase superfamily protein PhnB
MSMYPIVRYRDQRAGMEWLCRAFGFEKHAVHEGPDGELEHIELRHGDGIVMVSSEQASDPAFSGKAGEAAVYVVIEDPDSHHERARAEGAEIVMELRDTDYGSRDYAARDPDGNLWSFGTYRPL